MAKAPNENEKTTDRQDIQLFAVSGFTPVPHLVRIKHRASGMHLPSTVAAAFSVQSTSSKL